jgi:group I intron endonuclease
VTTSGIYVIRNISTGRFYVGSSKGCERRWIYHRSTLRRGIHGNSRLQADWTVHGEASFTFTVICLLDPDQLLATEQRLLDRLVGRPDCFNLDAHARGIWEWTESARVAAASSRRGKPLTPAHREAISRANMGRPKSPEAVAKLRARMRGKPSPFEGRRHTEASRAKLSAARKGKTFGPRANKRRPDTDETRARKSASRLAFLARTAGAR